MDNRNSAGIRRIVVVSGCIDQSDKCVSEKLNRSESVSAYSIVFIFSVIKLVQAIKAAKSFVSTGQGFNTLKELKANIGSPGENKQWHHIVEQCQITKSGFSPQKIHNTNNIIALDKSIHAKISGFFKSTTRHFTKGLSVRGLAGKSFRKQYKFGIKVLKMFGGLK